ncbi:MAG TPA: hypothetical protein PLV45_17855, partial [bacterium]|nr:hypothetical protein [bacterium]
MKFFSGLKARKLAKSIEKYPDVFRNYRELIELHITAGDLEDAAESIRWAEQRTWDTADTAWLRIQKLTLQSQTGDDPAKMLETALDVATDAAVELPLRLDAARTVAPLLLEHRRDLPPDLTRRTVDILTGLAGEAGDSAGTMDLMLYLAEWDAEADRAGAALDRMKIVLRQAETARRKHLGTLYFKAARIAARAGAPSEEIRSLNLKALESGDLSDAQTVDALVSVAAALRSEDDLLGAMERYETALRFAGTHRTRAVVLIHFELARVYFELGRIPQAEREIGEALACRELAGDDRAEILLWTARSDVDRQRYDAAEQRISDALASVSNSALK